MKTKGMKHQLAALKAMEGRDGFALLMEMGTGKTWAALADAERLYKAGRIDSLAVVAPKGVHTNWILREIPAHLSVDHVALEYSSAKTKKAEAAMKALMAPAGRGRASPLRIFAINYEAIRYPRGFDALEAFIAGNLHPMLVLDEAIRVKNHKAKTSTQLIRLRHLCDYRRILNGSPTGGTPLDLFGQFEQLGEGLLGTNSFRAFTSEYSVLLEEGNALFDTILAQARAHNPRANPQVVAKDKTGAPRWRNLEKLRACVAPHAYRVRKADCLDLPPKVYTQRFFELEPKQMAAYKLLEDDLRIQYGDEFLEVAPLAATIKLQQITSGFVMIEGVPQWVEGSANPRLDLLIDAMEDIPGQCIVWCRFREEIRQVVEALQKLELRVCEYHGGTDKRIREGLVDGFQRGDFDVFVGQQQAGGLGITLTAAEAVVYYSNDYNLVTRQQSEDRAHRHGQKKTVVYIDLLARDTVDSGIIESLRRKAKTAAFIADGLAP